MDLFPFILRFSIKRLEYYISLLRAGYWSNPYHYFRCILFIPETITKDSLILLDGIGFGHVTDICWVLIVIIDTCV